MSGSHKFSGLDSLRGLAALMVVFQHFWETNHQSEERLRPWLFFCAGHEAVILFFVLSGFVLSHQLRNFSWANYPRFIYKRVIRIYPAYYLALLASFLGLVFISRYHAATLADYGLSNWFYIWSRTSYDHTLFWGSLSLISHSGNSLDVATWTLFYEMWLSLFFPGLLAIGLHRRLYWRLLALALLVALSYFLWRQGLLLENAWAAIIYYAWYFMLGMFLYHYRERLWLSGAGIYLVLGCVLYFSNFLFFGKITSRLLHELLIAGGSVLIISAALFNSYFTRWLNWGVWRFYGKISYSLYLWHLPLLYVFSYLFLAKYGLFSIKIMVFAGATLLSSLSYYYIELKLCNWLKNFNKEPHRYVK